MMRIDRGIYVFVVDHFGGRIRVVSEVVGEFVLLRGGSWAWKHLITFVGYSQAEVRDRVEACRHKRRRLLRSRRRAFCLSCCKLVPPQ